MKIQFKQKTRPRMSCQWIEKSFRKKSDPKKSKKQEKSEWNCRMWTKNHYRETEFFSNTIFSLYIKIRAKKIHAAKPLAFSLHFLFRRGQNHHSNLTSKIMKMCEQILKKNIARRTPETTRRIKLPILMT